MQRCSGIGSNSLAAASSQNLGAQFKYSPEKFAQTLKAYPPHFPRFCARDDAELLTGVGFSAAAFYAELTDTSKIRFNAPSSARFLINPFSA
ncbi:hypothetical protein [Paraburkholderia atlantica]|uniref:hypothetical protein n=1 Tax=Paraburkholderia atlantica TaxID=2654982 RepID=UPI001621DAFF|nr:hypothetical protein [Paraburkholderia atlantica]MBB5506643.1 hypothetical protein [Paraburkholderia atlantica]